MFPAPPDPNLVVSAPLRPGIEGHGAGARSGTIGFGRRPLEVRLYGVAEERGGGRYVPLEQVGSIELRGFARPDEVDPVRLRCAYYVVPKEGAERNYRLLARALEETGRVGLAEVAIRSATHSACLRSAKGFLLLQTLYGDDELLRPEALEGEPDCAELAAVRSLVEHIHARTAA